MGDVLIEHVLLSTVGRGGGVFCFGGCSRPEGWQIVGKSFLDV